MKTFAIQTLGCKVNQYESEQLATLLTARGLVRVADPRDAHLRVVNTCSVTLDAAAKSRQTVRRTTRLPVLSDLDGAFANRQQRVVVTGCWATSNTREAEQLPGVDAVITHADDVAGQLDRLLRDWEEDRTRDDQQAAGHVPGSPHSTLCSRPHVQEPIGYEGSMIEAGTPGVQILHEPHSRPHEPIGVKRKLLPPSTRSTSNIVGTRTLPLLQARQTDHQRAFVKVQDGCDAHCTYCIIPQLRPAVWSKPVDDAVEEARRLVAAGHLEIVLTGIFLGAYGQPTALRRRQPTTDVAPIARLVDALCTRVPGLRRLRFSSLEPGDLTRELIQNLKSHWQVVPHFHLPLQSGSDETLRRMNRQYTRSDYLLMIDQVRSAFDRPAITTDVIVGFPDETEDEFARTLEVVDRARFIHIHAFPFSPRPGTAASRWTGDFIDPRIAQRRIKELSARAAACGFAFRQEFVDETADLLVERRRAPDELQHGRCARYFDVQFDHDRNLTGALVRVRIDEVTATSTRGTLIEVLEEPR